MIDFDAFRLKCANMNAGEAGIGIAGNRALDPVINTTFHDTCNWLLKLVEGEMPKECEDVQVNNDVPPVAPPKVTKKTTKKK